MVTLEQFVGPVGVLVDLVHYQHLAAAFIEFIGEGEDPSFGEIEIVEVDVEAVARIAELFPYKIEKEGGFADAAKTLDAYDPGIPVDFMMEFPVDSDIVGIDQELMGFEKIFHRF